MSVHVIGIEVSHASIEVSRCLDNTEKTRASLSWKVACSTGHWRLQAGVCLSVAALRAPLAWLFPSFRETNGKKRQMMRETGNTFKTRVSRLP
jgi:hypothetical protein